MRRGRLNSGYQSLRRGQVRDTALIVAALAHLFSLLPWPTTTRLVCVCVCVCVCDAISRSPLFPINQSLKNICNVLLVRLRLLLLAPPLHLCRGCGMNARPQALEMESKRSCQLLAGRRTTRSVVRRHPVSNLASSLS